MRPAWRWPSPISPGRGGFTWMIVEWIIAQADRDRHLFRRGRRSGRLRLHRVCRSDGGVLHRVAAGIVCYWAAPGSSTSSAMTRARYLRRPCGRRSHGADPHRRVPVAALAARPAARGQSRPGADQLIGVAPCSSTLVVTLIILKVVDMVIGLLSARRSNAKARSRAARRKRPVDARRTAIRNGPGQPSGSVMGHRAIPKQY